MTILGATLFASLILISCNGGSIESDAKKIADVQCRSKQLMQKAIMGDMSEMAESSKLASESIALSKQIEGKYTSDSDKKKFAEALLKAMGNCK